MSSKNTQNTIPVKCYDFSPTDQNITFEPPTFNANGYGNVVINYLDSVVCLQTHKMKTPFGFSRGIPNTQSYGRDLHLNVNMSGGPEPNKDQAFSGGLKQLEELIINQAYENRLEWGLYDSKKAAEQASFEDVKSKFSPMIRPPKPGSTYPATMRLGFKSKKNLQTQTYHIESDCYDASKNAITPSEETIPRRSYVRIITIAQAIWLSPQGRYGLKWTINQVVVYPPDEGQGSSLPAVNLPKGQLLLMDDSDDES